MSRIKKPLYLALSMDALEDVTKIPNLEKKPAIKYDLIVFFKFI